MKLKDI